jgi:hypothetical protein
MRLFDIIKRDLNDKQAIFWPKTDVDRSILDYPLALVSAPFELLGALRRKKAYQGEARHSPEPVAEAPSPRKPTIAELKAKLDRDLGDADLLPVSPEERAEIKAQIELRSLKQMEHSVDGTL